MHRLYANKDISVFWNSDKCFHAKKCVTGCPEAFDITRKPWINIDDAPTAKVWQAVSNCPSGALTVTYNHDVDVSFDDIAMFDQILNICEDLDIITYCIYSPHGGHMYWKYDKKYRCTMSGGGPSAGGEVDWDTQPA